MRPQRSTRAPHGTVTRYTAGCSCFECCEAWREYQLERRADMEAGRPRLVDVAPVREHLRRLYSMGVSRRAAANMALVSYRTLRLVDGSCALKDGTITTRVRREFAEAILAITRPTPGAYTAWIPAADSKRLITRMKRTMTYAEIGRIAGLNHKTVQDIHTRNTRIQADNALAIERAAESLGIKRVLIDRERFSLLMAEGYPTEDIAEAIGCSVRHAERIERELKEEAA